MATFEEIDEARKLLGLKSPSIKKSMMLKESGGTSSQLSSIVELTRQRSPIYGLNSSLFVEKVEEGIKGVISYR